MPAPLRVLILGAADADLIVAGLRRAGFAPHWRHAASEVEYLTALETLPQIIFAAEGAPDCAPLQALRPLDERGLEIPFIVVVESGAEAALEAALAAVKQGAWDYLRTDRLSALSSVVNDALAEKAMRDGKRQAEAALRATAERLAGIVASAMDAIVAIDANRRLTLFNRAAEQVFGWAADAALGQPIERFIPTWPIWPARPTAPAALSATPAGAPPQLLKGRRADGQDFPIEASVSHIETGGETSTTIILRDVTEARRARARVEESERLRALGEMASGIAHDFNNMLAIILGRSELLLGLLTGSDTAARLAPHIEVVKQAARDGEETVKRLQTFSGVSRRPSTGAIDVGAVLRDVVEFTRPRWKDRAQQNGVTIQVEVAAETLPLLVGNPADLREVLVNMVFNAVDALPEGGAITLRARQHGDEVVLQVSDTGVGMADDVRRRVFDPFFSTKGTRGAGLGLSMSYGIVARLGGRIEVESAPHNGTTFSIILPSQVAEAGAEEPAPGPVQSHLSILLVDDEPQILATTRLMLEVDGHRVTAVESGAQALTLLGAAPDRYDVVLTDLGMPEMNGMQLLAAMRAAGVMLPCVLVTGWGIELAGDDMEAAGAQAVLPKPFSATQLREALTAIARGR